jgi:hypothetical protein
MMIAPYQLSGGTSKQRFCAPAKPLAMALLTFENDRRFTIIRAAMYLIT